MRPKLKPVVTQAKIAESRGVSQQAISKKMAKADGLQGDINQARLKKLRAAAELAEMDRDERKGRLVESDRQKSWLSAALARLRARLDGRLRSDLPARMGGMPADKIAAAIGEELDAAYAELQKEVVK